MIKGKIKDLKIDNLQIFETGNKYGNMNTAKAFYPDCYNAFDRKGVFLKRRMMVGEEYGFDGHKMYVANQKAKTGTYFELDRDFVEANPDGWEVDIDEDILIVNENVPKVVIGHPVADCPVVMAYDAKNKAVAIAHCSAELVDKLMPISVIDALSKKYNSKDEDIITYISACAGESWTYDRYPSWAQNERVWENAIKESEDKLYHINLKLAVLRQLRERNIENIIMQDIDTITDDNFYSNSASRTYEKKKGRHFAGAFFR